MILKFYRKPALSPFEIERALVKSELGRSIDSAPVNTERCFYVEVSATLTKREEEKLRWILAETFEPENFGETSFLSEFSTVLEAGPRLNFQTAWSSTAGAQLESCGLKKVVRIERSLRLGLATKMTADEEKEFLSLFYDRMTEMRYLKPLKSFESDYRVEPVKIIPLLEQDMEALDAICKELGLSLDEQDKLLFYHLFAEYLKRNPTNVELFQFGQANSEHSRHMFFRGVLRIDGQKMEESLMNMIKTPWRKNPRNALVAFDGAVIRGGKVKTLVPMNPGRASAMALRNATEHFTITAETHNHPTLFSPFDGAATGPGGGLRDALIKQLFGIGGVGYCTSNLHLPGDIMPWEENDVLNPGHTASPLEILIQGSNGASWYHNCFGEPLGGGFLRTFGMRIGNEYWAWLKPILFTSHTGQKREEYLSKEELKQGMLVLQIGGPAYPIGMGGAAGSSRISAKENAELDFNSVQRGDPEMEQRMSRVIRALVAMGKRSPVVAMQDLGAGGDCNAIPELVYPVGALINLRAIPTGDPSLSALEIWGNEAQERMVFVIKSKDLPLVEYICRREKCPLANLGKITGDGRIRLYDERDGTYPVDLPLEQILGDMPPKTFDLARVEMQLPPLVLPPGLTLLEALKMVLCVPGVGSKSFLTRKIDRSVGGKLIQQPCVGPNHLPLSDYAVKAAGYFDKEGFASSIGEQPIKGFISAKKSVDLALAEAILNMAGAVITDFKDIKCLANWMLAAKLAGEGSWLYDAVSATRDAHLEYGIAPVGGKDSLSMALETESGIVKAPRELVISACAPMPDVNLRVTPDIKQAGNSLLFIDLAKGKNRLGSSTLGQVLGQIGNACPGVEDKALVVRAFEAVQELIKKEWIVSLHDRSDGGLIVALLEMAFAGNVGLNIDMESGSDILETFFSEEIGLVLECGAPKKVMKFLAKRKVPAEKVAMITSDCRIKVKHNKQLVMDESMLELRQIWEATSTAIEKLQANPECAKEEAKNIFGLVMSPPYKLTFTPKRTPRILLMSKDKPRVAVIREEGSNGDEEMIAALYAAGFEPWDVTMTDLLSGDVNLDDFRGVVFVGGFAYGDVMDAAKGWAAVIRFNPRLKKMFDRFYARTNTFSLGVCNGCQLMALLGWVPWRDIPDKEQPRFIRNKSGRFESRFSTVKIRKSRAIMLCGMEGSKLGIWMAHGEGQFYTPAQWVLDKILEQGLAPIRFVDSRGITTESYPFNCNGSPHGIAAVCSEDGRHLAFMGHPERTFQLRQWAYLPEEWKNLQTSPWFRMFQNAYDWCMTSRK